MQRQVWLIPLADERVDVQVELWNPLRTRAISERFCGGDSLRRGAIYQVCVLYLYLKTLCVDLSWILLPICFSSLVFLVNFMLGSVRWGKRDGLPVRFSVQIKRCIPVYRIVLSSTCAACHSSHRNVIKRRSMLHTNHNPKATPEVSRSRTFFTSRAVYEGSSGTG